MVRAYTAGPEASEASHHTKARNPAAAAHPVMRWRIDSDIVYANLYTPRCGDRGRWFMRLKIDAAAVFFPVAEARGLGARGTAVFPDRNFGGQGGFLARRPQVRRSVGGGSVWRIGRDVRHGREFCQNCTATTT